MVLVEWVWLTLYEVCESSCGLRTAHRTCYDGLIEVLCLILQSFPILPYDSLGKTFIVSNFRNLSTFCEFYSDNNSCMFPDISGPFLSIPGGPIKFCESLLRIVGVHVPEENWLIPCERGNNGEFAHIRDSSGVSEILYFFSKNWFHSFCMDSVPGKFVDICALYAFDFPDKVLLRITPSPLEPLRCFIELGRKFVYWEKSERIRFGYGRMTGKGGMIVVEMCERIRFAGKTGNLLGMFESVP